MSEAVLDTTAIRRWKRREGNQRLPLDWEIKIPADWKIHRLKEIADARPSNVDKKSQEGERSVRLCNYVDVYKNDLITEAIEFMEATASDSQIEQFGIQSGDVIITKDSESWDDIAVPAYVPNMIDNLVCGYHLTLIRPDSSVLDGSFLARCIQAEGLADQFRVMANGITRYGIGTQGIRCAVIPVPLLSEQRAIAAFLDRETARIDALVAKKQRLIELLEEKRQAIISEAVTKGLKPNAEGQQARLFWLDSFPYGWTMTRLKFVADIQTGLTLGKNYGDRELVERPYLRVANVQDGYLDLEEITNVSVPAEDVARHELQAGDVLMTEGGDFDKLGRGFVWEGQIPGCLHQNHVFAVRPNQDFLLPHYLSALMTSFHGKTYFTFTSQQSTNLASTNSTKLGNFPIPIPSVEKQTSILRFIAERSGTIKECLKRIRKGIGSLTEYRSALISAAVTGQIDVRDEVQIDE